MANLPSRRLNGEKAGSWGSSAVSFPGAGDVGKRSDSGKDQAEPKTKQTRNRERMLICMESWEGSFPYIANALIARAFINVTR